MVIFKKSSLYIQLIWSSINYVYLYFAIYLLKYNLKMCAVWCQVKGTGCSTIQRGLVIKDWKE